ncbi:MAG: DUF4747 family protein [Nitrosospira sp.]
MHTPHSPQRYVELFSETYRGRIEAVARGDQNVLIGALDYVDKDHPETGITGELYRYSQFDSDEPWFNIRNREEASEEEIKQIRIPENLKPHFSRFPFVFLPKGHRLYIEIRKYGKVSSPHALATAFRRLFADERLGNFGPVEVTAEPQRDALKLLFQIPFIRTLTIEIVRPNPDDGGVLQRRFMKKLEDQNASTMEIKLSASRDERLIPDDDTKAIAGVAASNGYVRASGRNMDGLAITRSTRDIPLIERATYDSDIQSSNDALLQTAMRLHTSFTP